jgi:hypothetical protein
MSRPDSRLDDELRNAFRREQPSADFTTRLLERVSRERQLRPRWWTKLAMLLEPPKLRWVAIGVTASLLLAIGAMQYSKLRHTPAGDRSTVAETTSSADPSSKDAVNSETFNRKPQQSTVAVGSRPDIQRSALKHRLVLARHQEERELRAEGEAAKEKLMLALSIASSALNDAQKAIHDDGIQP